MIPQLTKLNNCDEKNETDSECSEESDILDEDEDEDFSEVVATLIMSSDEELELEAQRIRFDDGLDSVKNEDSNKVLPLVPSTVVTLEKPTPKEQQSKKASTENKQKYKQRSLPNPAHVTTLDRTKPCGIIRFHAEQRLFIYNCSFCDFRCDGRLDIMSQHLQVHEFIETEQPPIKHKKVAQAQPKRKSARNQAKIKTKIDEKQEGPPNETFKNCGTMFFSDEQKNFRMQCEYCEGFYTDELYETHVNQEHTHILNSMQRVDNADTLVKEEVLPTTAPIVDAKPREPKLVKVKKSPTPTPTTAVGKHVDSNALLPIVTTPVDARPRETKAKNTKSPTPMSTIAVGKHEDNNALLHMATTPVDAKPREPKVKVTKSPTPTPTIAVGKHVDNNALLPIVTTPVDARPRETKVKVTKSPTPMSTIAVGKHVDNNALLPIVTTPVDAKPREPKVKVTKSPTPTPTIAVGKHVDNNALLPIVTTPVDARPRETKVKVTKSPTPMSTIAVGKHVDNNALLPMATTPVDAKPREPKVKVTKSPTPMPTIAVGKHVDNNALLPMVTTSTRVPDTPPPEEHEKDITPLLVVEKPVADTNQEEDIKPQVHEGENEQEQDLLIVKATKKKALPPKQRRNRQKSTTRRSPSKRKKNKKSVVELSPEPTEQEPTRKRRTVSVQKSFTDDFNPQMQQPPSSPESAASCSKSTLVRLRLPNTATLSKAEPDLSEETKKKIPAASSTDKKLRYVCDQCPKSFNKSSRLTEHQRLHTGEKPFSCDECGKSFRIKMRLSEHKLRHRKEKAFKCETCGLAVATRQDLTLHQRHHSNDRRYGCAECPRAFVRSSDLKIHLRVHSGEKPFTCEVCQKSFRANQNLIVHRRSHGGEKNYPCDICGKRFMRNIDRKVHYRTHTGEKPYKCEICQRGYSSRFHVRGHIEREHVAPLTGGKTSERKKPKGLREELAKSKKLIEDLKKQLQQQIKQDDDEEIVDHLELLTENEQKQEMEIEIENKGEEKEEIVPPSREQSTSPTLAQLMRKVEQNSHQCVNGMQQVSVTVSMQVGKALTTTSTTMSEDVSTLPAKENDSTLLVVTDENAPGGHKITSYFITEL